MRHLRDKFNAKIAVSLLETKRRCYEGYNPPRVKVIHHREGDKEEEKIVAEYQDIKAEFKKAVEVLLRVNQVRKRRRVKRIRLVVGGDHGQGAFRLGFKVLIDVESADGEERKVLHKTVNIATVHCKKEVGAILESTVIDWVAEDLKYINENRLHLLNVDRLAVTCFESDLDLGALRGLVDYNNDTPKLHCIEDHAVDALERHPDLLLMIEEWVEQLHQTEKKRVENRTKYIKDAFKRAECASKKRAAVNDATLMARDRQAKRPRPAYKPRQRNA